MSRLQTEAALIPQNILNNLYRLWCGWLFCTLIGTALPVTAKETSELEWLEEQIKIFQILSERSAEQFTSSHRINLHQLIARSARQYGLNENVLASIILIESNGKPCAVSPQGAKGLGQLMDATANMLGVWDAFQPQQNLAGAASYFARQLVAAKGDTRLAAAAYNYGPKAIHKSRWPTETRSYVYKFQKYIRKFRTEDWRTHLPKYIPMTNQAICSA